MQPAVGQGLLVGAMCHVLLLCLVVQLAWKLHQQLAWKLRSVVQQLLAHSVMAGAEGQGAQGWVAGKAEAGGVWQVRVYLCLPVLPPVVP